VPNKLIPLSFSKDNIEGLYTKTKCERVNNILGERRTKYTINKTVRNITMRNKRLKSGKKKDLLS
jgi:hypothetical protein